MTLSTRHSLLAASLLASVMATPAYAVQPSSDWYLGLSGDLTWLHSDTGAGGNVALGYRFPQGSLGNFRLEAEAGYHGVDNTHYITYMGNMYYDFGGMFPASGAGLHISPYIGGGLGDAEVHYGSNGSVSGTFHHHSNNFAYQGMAGLNFNSSSMPNTDWSLGYRYLGTDRNNGVRLDANNLEVGVRFHF